MKLHLPYFSEKTVVTVRDEAVEIKAFQAVVLVSISAVGNTAWDPGIPKFPAIIDTGHTHNFALTKKHLVKWAGIQTASMPRLKSMRKEGTKVPLYSAGLWFHTDADPFYLSMDDGIAVFDGDWPRLPIFGLRALTKNNLQTFIYGDTKQVVIRTPPKWYWPF